MTIALVPGQTASVKYLANVTQMVVTLPNPPTRGNLVVLGFGTGPGAVTASDGVNAYTPSPSTPHTDPAYFSGTGGVGIFYLPNVPRGAGATVTVNVSVASGGQIWIAEFSGAPLSPVVVDAVAVGSGLTITSPSVTTIRGGDLLFSACISAGALSINAPWTAVDIREDGNWAEYYVQPTAGSQSVNYGNSAGAWLTILADFSPPWLAAGKLVGGDYNASLIGGKATPGLGGRV